MKFEELTLFNVEFNFKNKFLHLKRQINSICIYVFDFVENIRLLIIFLNIIRYKDKMSLNML